MSGEDLMSKHLKLSSNNYEREWKHFKEFLQSQSKVATPVKGWLVPENSWSFPTFDVEFLEDYSAWLLDHYKKGSLVHSQAAINYYYAQAKLPSPWLGRRFTRIMTKYIDARKSKMVAAREFTSGQTPMGCRVPVPEDVIENLLAIAEGLPDVNPNKSYITIILIGFLFLLRASSLYFEEGDIKFITNGDGRKTTLVIQSLCVKAKSKAAKIQMRCPAPAEELGPSQPRARIFTLIEKCLEKGDLHCIASPEEASATVTKWMQDIIPAELASLVEGEKITSHSLRKAGASALCSLGMDIKSKVMPWGGWKTVSSAEKYPVLGYLVTRFSGGVFSWMLPKGSPFEWAL